MRGDLEDKPRVLVTLRLEGEGDARDLELPADVPVGEWLPGVSVALGWQAHGSARPLQDYTLRSFDPLSEQIAVVNPSQTLAQAGVCDGFRLELSLPPPGGAARKPTGNGPGVGAESELDVDAWVSRPVDEHTIVTSSNVPPRRPPRSRRTGCRPVAFERGPRQIRKPPEETVELYPPEPRPTEPTSSLMATLLPSLITMLVMGAVVGVMAAMGSTAMVTTMLISIPMLLASSLAGALRPRLEKRSYRRKVLARERQYQAMLEEKRSHLGDLQILTRKTLLENDPDPEGCLDLVEGQDARRLWARAPTSEDFLRLRVGIGSRPFQVKIKAPGQPSPLNPDPLVESAAALCDEFGRVPDVPVCLSLPQERVVGLAGPDESVRNGVRALAVQIATHHLPTEVKMVVLFSVKDTPHWEWLRWLPHVASEDRADRLLASARPAALRLLDDLHRTFNARKLQRDQRKRGSSGAQGPAYVILVLDQTLVKGHTLLPDLKCDGPDLGFYPIFAANEVSVLPEECGAIVELVGDLATVRFKDLEVPPAAVTVDEVSPDLADQFSRTMAPIRVKAGGKEAGIPPLVTLLEALGVQRVEDLDVLVRWSGSDPTQSLAVPMGKRAGGKIQNVDLHEPRPEPTTQSGHGPHALLAGQSGYGKSELLQSLMVSLAVNFHPHELVMVVGDFKPPGVSPVLFGLPHVVNVIHSNQLAEVPRALQSLEAELARRSRLYTQAGVSHIDAYMGLHKAGDPRAAEPLPYLVLIVDEFQALRNELPQALEKFVKVAAQGRAYGFRMILATQSLATAIPATILANTALRLCLGTANATESQNVIERPDAASLTSRGRTYLRVGQDLVFEQFQCAWGGEIHLWTHQAYMAFSCNGTWCNRGFAVQIHPVGDPANVPQLQRDTATGRVYRLGDVGPASDLVGRPDARGVRVANAHWRYRSGFAQDQAC